MKLFLERSQGTTRRTPLSKWIGYQCESIPDIGTPFCVSRVGQLHDLALKLGAPTTFNMVWELQQVASTLTYSQVQDLNVFVDPDHAWISIGMERLRLDCLQSRMARLIQDAKAVFQHLS